MRIELVVLFIPIQRRCWAELICRTMTRWPSKYPMHTNGVIRVTLDVLIAECWRTHIHTHGANLQLCFNTGLTSTPSRDHTQKSILNMRMRANQYGQAEGGGKWSERRRRRTSPYFANHNMPTVWLNVRYIYKQLSIIVIGISKEKYTFSYLFIVILRMIHSGAANECVNEQRPTGIMCWWALCNVTYDRCVLECFVGDVQRPLSVERSREKKIQK